MSGANAHAYINFPAELEDIYNLHSAVLYGIAVEISPTEEEADEVFVDTFIKIHDQMRIEPNHTFKLVQLIKLVIQTSDQHQAKAHHTSTLKLKRPEQLPIMHLLLCEKQSPNHICLDTEMTKKQAGKKLRQEFKRLKNMKSGNTWLWIA